MKALKKQSKRSVALEGPSLFEVEYLRQMKEELETFLRSKNFSTIREFQIGFKGSDYVGRMQVKA